MLVLSDEPKALVHAAERLLDLSPNIRKNFTIDELAFRLNDYIRELRATGNIYIGTSGFMVYRFEDEGHEEVSIMLNVCDFNQYDAPGEVSQQFLHDGSKWSYDESCPEEWREDA